MQCQTHLLELVAVFLLLLSHCCCLIVLLSCCAVVSLDLIHKDILLHLIWKDALLHLIWKDISSHLLWKYILLYFIWDNILLHLIRKFLLHLYLRNICWIYPKRYPVVSFLERYLLHLIWKDPFTYQSQIQSNGLEMPNHIWWKVNAGLIEWATSVYFRPLFVLFKPHWPS